LGVGGLGLGGVAPRPNPQSPIPNPQSPIPTFLIFSLLFFIKKILKIKNEF